MLKAKKWLGGKLNYSNLVRELAITEFKLKYHGSALGYLWSFAKPLMLFSVLYFVFTRFVRIGGGVPHFPLYLLLGIVFWVYFSDATNTAMNSIVDRGDLIRKVYFPRWIIVIGSSVSSVLTFALNLLVIIGFTILAGIPFNLKFLLLGLLIIELYALSLAFSLFLSALYVKYRDFKHIWEVGLQIMFYATPIIYPLTIVPAKYRGFLLLNPVAQIIQDARGILITDQTIRPGAALNGAIAYVPYVLPFVMLGIAYLYFTAAAAKFAEEV